MKAGFIREVYLRSFPSIDIKKVGLGAVVPHQHTIGATAYDALVKEYCESNSDLIYAARFMICCGPKIVEG